MSCRPTCPLSLLLQLEVSDNRIASIKWEIFHSPSIDGLLAPFVWIFPILVLYCVVFFSSNSVSFLSNFKVKILDRKFANLIL